MSRRRPLALCTLLSLLGTAGCGPAPVRGVGVDGDADADVDPGDGLPDVSEERCGDGVDNDLDGRAEEDCPCAPMTDTACFMGPASARGVGACLDGTMTCRGDESTEWGSYGECVGSVGPSPETCDGVDNDCNGRVDEDPMCNADPPEAICPPDVTTPALRPVVLEGGCRDDSGECTSYEWSVVGAPGGSAASPDPAVAQTTTFTADLAGEYTLRLTVRDAGGAFDDCDVHVTVPTSEGLRVEIYWNDPDQSCGDDDWDAGFPACDDSDVDLHMINTQAQTWFSGDDCYFSNCKRDFASVEWNAAGADDNPFLDIDDVEGHGPENINIESPAAGESYTIGVHYWSPDSWEGGASVFVKVYCGGNEPVDEFGPVALPERDDFWRVANVVFDDNGACHIEALDRAGANLTDQATVRAAR